jgi:hypothetical protein
MLRRVPGRGMKERPAGRVEGRSGSHSGEPAWAFKFQAGAPMKEIAMDSNSQRREDEADSGCPVSADKAFCIYGFRRTEECRRLRDEADAGCARECEAALVARTPEAATPFD